jgi:hypothetical protein
MLRAGAAPSAAAIKAGSVSGAVREGKDITVAAATEAAVALSGLAVSTTYTVYVVAEDSTGVVLSAVVSSEFATIAECTDSTSYTDAGGYGCADWVGYPCDGETDSVETKKQCPKTCDACPPPVAVPVKPILSSVAVSSITKTGASLAATSDQNGFIYYSVLAAKASTPSAADVKTAGEATKTASAAASAATIVVSSLTAGTEYKVRRREGIVVTTRTYEYQV